jgi:hypothetical protein
MRIRYESARSQRRESGSQEASRDRGRESSNVHDDRLAGRVLGGVS